MLSRNSLVASSLTLSSWDKILINDFHEKLNMILDEIYKRTDLISNEFKTSISISFSEDEKVMLLNNCFRKKNIATNVLSFPSNHTFNKKLCSPFGIQ